jgi:hypothetical protein
MLQIHSIFRSELSQTRDQMLPLSSSRISFFPYCNPVAAYVFFLVHRALVLFLQQRVLEYDSYVSYDQFSYLPNVL